MIATQEKHRTNITTH